MAEPATFRRLNQSSDDGLGLLQVHSSDLVAVLDIVMAHQGSALRGRLVARLLGALVLPGPEHYRAHLRRLAALEGMLTLCTLMFYRPQ